MQSNVSHTQTSVFSYYTTIVIGPGFLLCFLQYYMNSLSIESHDWELLGCQFRRAYYILRDQSLLFLG